MAKIIIVDDEPDVRELVKITLQRENHEVLEAKNGREALEKLEEEDLDLILLDINMPKMDGWETLNEMKKRGITREVPVTMFTVEKLTFVKMLRKDLENLVGYIEKPFPRDELVETVEGTLDRTQKIYDLKDKIMESPEGGKDLAKAFLAWNRTQMIHERLLEKLREMKKESVDEQKLSRVRNLIKGEERTIEEAKRKRVEIVRLAGIENLLSGD